MKKETIKKEAIKKAEKAYEEIFKVLNKHKDICIFDIRDLEIKSAMHVYNLYLEDFYGVEKLPFFYYT